MKIIDLLKEIEKGEINESIFYVNGDFFYDLIVIDKNLYVINTMTKQLELLQSKYISKFIRDNVELSRLDNFEEIIEEKEMCHKCHKYPAEYNQTWCEFCLGISQEEKEIPEKLEYYDDIIAWVIDNVGQLSDVDKVIIDKLNDVIDYLKRKGV